MNRIVHLAGLSFLFVAACGAPSEQRAIFPSQDVTVTRADLTRIYFVREGWVGVAEQEVGVYDNDAEIGTLSSDTYLCWERPGGRTVARAFYHAMGPMRGRIEGIADLNCDAGRAYYFNVTVEREDGKPTVVPLDDEEGKALVAKRRPAKH